MPLPLASLEGMFSRARSRDGPGTAVLPVDELNVMPSGDKTTLTSGLVSTAGEEAVTVSVCVGKGVYAGGKSSVAATLMISLTLSVSS